MIDAGADGGTGRKPIVWVLCPPNVTSEGAAGLVVKPFPTRPSLLLPQQMRRWSDCTAQAWLLPALTARYSVPAGGLDWLKSLRPLQISTPSEALTKQANPVPTLTAFGAFPRNGSAGSTGVATPNAVSPKMKWESALSFPEPQHRMAPFCCLMRQLDSYPTASPMAGSPAATRVGS